MGPEEIRSAVEYIDACLHDITERALPDEQDAFDEGLAERERLVSLLERHNRIAASAKIPERVEMTSGPEVIRTEEPVDVLNDRSATPSQLADAVTRSLEAEGVEPENLDHARKVLRRHRGDRDWSRGLLARSTEVYQEAWLKAVTGRQTFLSDEERAALAVGTNTQGGFLVPTHLDPTIILTNSGTSNAIRGISRVVTLTTGNVWNGVTSAGSTFSFDAELAEVSDDTPSVARVSIPVYKAQGFIQADIEAMEDISSLSQDVMMLIADGRDRLEGSAHATGSGSTAPTGIVTALDANTNDEIVATTAATFSLADLQKVYRNVPVRFRGRSTWLMNPYYLGQLQALGTALGASYTTDMTQPYTQQILGKRVVESDDMPNTVTTTANDNQIVFGDFSNFVIVDKPGSLSVEYVPHLFNTANNLPDGRSGWYVYWRTGADSVLDTAFRLYQSKTSA